MSLKAKVHNGRLVLDEPTNLPEGAIVELEPVDADDLDDEDRKRLHQALADSEEDVHAGHVYPIDAVLAEVRQRRAARR